ISSSQTVNAFPDGIYKLNNSLFVIGIYVYNSNSYGIWMLKLDYQTGLINKYVFYQLNHSIPYCDSLTHYPGQGSFTYAANGAFVYSRFLLYPSQCSPNDFFIARLDTNLNIINNQ